ncbi:MAG: flavodoxin domain-containing protein [Thermacetogeniaceae bacterium]
MNTVIIFASRYGTAKECAEILARQIYGSVDLVDIQTEGVPELAHYDQVIIGGSIRFGQIQKQIKRFCRENIEELTKKKICLVICFGLLENAKQNIENSFPQQLLDHAAAVECFGGKIDLNKLSFFDRIITNMVMKAVDQQGDKPAVLVEKIDRFCHEMNRDITKEWMKDFE